MIYHIGVVGKYVKSIESYLSLKKAIESAAVADEIKINLHWIDSEQLESEYKKIDETNY